MLWSYLKNKNKNRDEIWKGYKKEKCNQKIYECRIHECMLNVRETKLSHKFEAVVPKKNT